MLVLKIPTLVQTIKTQSSVSSVETWRRIKSYEYQTVLNSIYHFDNINYPLNLMSVNTTMINLYDFCNYVIFVALTIVVIIMIP